MKNPTQSVKGTPPLKRKFHIGQVVYNFSNCTYQRVIRVIRGEGGKFIYDTGSNSWMYEGKLLRPLNKREIGR